MTKQSFILFMQGTKDLTQGRIGEQLFKLALPIMASSFIQMAYSLTDMAWVGRLGSPASAAVGAVGMLVWTTSSIALLTKVGAEVSVGQSIGAYDEKAAKSFASHNITLALYIAVGWAALLGLGAHTWISLFQMNETITLRSSSYLQIISMGFPFVFLSLAFTGIYNAAGRSTIPFYISGIGLGLNIFLDPIFIYVFKYGINGAAWATVLSQMVVLTLFIYHVKWKSPLLNGFPLFCKLKLKETKRILKLGAPVATFNTLFSFVSLFLSSQAARSGGHLGVMALATGGQIEAITWTTAQGLSTALSAFISQNFAANKMHRVIKAWTTTLWMSGIVGGIITVCFIAFGSNIFGLFVPEEEAAKAGGIYLHIAGYSQLFMMLEISTQGVFYGIGRTIPPALTSIVLNYARIPLSWLLCQHMGVEGIWWAITLSSIAKGITLAGWFAIVKSKLYRVNPEKHVAEHIRPHDS